ncbi:RIP metalloprotease RseP [Streptococcus halotolerans]|uniref:RIP metalloprotease RseP n=1 Tax=Streptococcus halotolerans TaxID=1814128 RepID=UPI000787C3F5|nr:RIP metalloprotease RseP [Streptococcus halotolerans]
MQGLLAFIIIFGILVVVHEFGHFYFAKKSGILVREFAVGMGPKIFAHTGKDGTAYTIRALPLGGYVRMAGWGDDTTEIKTGTPVTLTLTKDGLVKRINLSQKHLEQTSLPMNVTDYDLEDKLTITGLVLDETRTYDVDHDATIIEEDGTEVRIAPLDVQYQNATVWGRMMTNFAGPMNNFILGALVFIIMMFVQGGTPNPDSNQVRVSDGGAMQVAGVQNGDRILRIGSMQVSNWEDLTKAVDKNTRDLKKGGSIDVLVATAGGQERQLQIRPKKSNGTYLIGVMPGLKTGFMDKIVGGLRESWNGATLIVRALKNLITDFSLNKLGGPVAMYQMSNQAAKSGLVDLLYLMAMLSINLGIFNLVPIPALDGGKIFINIIEAIRRKPLSQEVETYVTLAGVGIMVVLMIAVTWNDIIRAFF